MATINGKSKLQVDYSGNDNINDYIFMHINKKKIQNQNQGYNSLAIVAKNGQLKTGQVIMKHLRSSPGSWWLRREHINHVNEHNELAYVST